VRNVEARQGRGWAKLDVSDTKPYHARTTKGHRSCRVVPVARQEKKSQEKAGGCSGGPNMDGLLQGVVREELGVRVCFLR